MVIESLREQWVWVRLHAGFMTGTMASTAIAGGFALVPGRHIANFLGY